MQPNNSSANNWSDSDSWAEALPVPTSRNPLDYLNWVQYEGARQSAIAGSDIQRGREVSLVVLGGVLRARNELAMTAVIAQLIFEPGLLLNATPEELLAGATRAVERAEAEEKANGTGPGPGPGPIPPEVVASLGLDPTKPHMGFEVTEGSELHAALEASQEILKKLIIKELEKRAKDDGGGA